LRARINLGREDDATRFDRCADRRIVTTAPLVVVEVLSPDDWIANYNQRIADYIDRGIRGVWILHPETRKGRDCFSGNWETAVFRLADSPIHLDLSATQ
jgi:Uma2 family endonuclease